MYLLSWRKTSFLRIISILSRKLMSKLINGNCLHFIGCQNYPNVLISHVLYQIQVTALLPFFQSISALTTVEDHVMKYSETAYSNSNDNYFWSIKNSSEVIEKLRLRNFHVLRYLLSYFVLYTHHLHMILSKQKCCPWSACVSTESQNLTSDSFSHQTWPRFQTGEA